MVSVSKENLIVIGLALALKDKKRRKRSYWVREWLKKRDQFSHTILLNELRLEPEDWFNYMRMNEETYLELLNYVTPLIQRQDTRMRKAITPHERLAATLRFLATGRSLRDLSFSTGIAACTLSRIIPETCQAIYNTLKKDYLKASFLNFVFSNNNVKVINAALLQ